MRWKATSPRHARDRGFTLVELLVVVLILGVLAALVVPLYLRQKDKAAAGATAANVRNVQTLVVSAQENTQKTLRDITGSGCSTCSCRVSPSVPLLKVSDPAFPTSTCGAQWTVVAQALSTASGEPLEATKRLLTDGWGYPLTIDENESDPSNGSPCGVPIDQIFSAGPNHVLRTAANGWIEADDKVTWLNPSGYC